MNSALQLGSAIGLAIITAIETNVEGETGGSANYDGRAAGYWFLLGIACTEVLVVLVFLKGEPTALVEKEIVEQTDAGTLEKVEDSNSHTPEEDMRPRTILPG